MREAQNEPVVATLPRWAASSAGLAAIVGMAIAGTFVVRHVSPAASTIVSLALLAVIPLPLLALALLRAEESRLARDLRTTRTGTPVLRGLLVRRRQELPFLTRWSATKLGTAALLLADGDREGAVGALSTASMFVRGGRLDRLREVVDADLDRSSGTPAGLDRCVQRLRAASPLGNREADLYRLHVMVKAILARGDDETAAQLATELGASSDDEVRVYGTWLRVWFELDAPGTPEDGGEGGEGGEGQPWPALSEGDMRLAMLAARVHGAESLVEKLTDRLNDVSAIARPGRGG
jgi:hypothetical protein